MSNVNTVSHDDAKHRDPFVEHVADSDPVETQEWLDSLEKQRNC